MGQTNIEPKDDMPISIPICPAGDFAEGDCRVVTVNNKDVAIFHTEGQFFAIDDRCPHAGSSLSGGHVEGGIVTCPWHGWRFRLCDGSWADNPKVKTGAYPVTVENGTVTLQLPSNG